MTTEVNKGEKIIAMATTAAAELFNISEKELARQILEGNKAFKEAVSFFAFVIVNG